MGRSGLRTRSRHPQAHPSAGRSVDHLLIAVGVARSSRHDSLVFDEPERGPSNDLALAREPTQHLNPDEQATARELIEPGSSNTKHAAGPADSTATSGVEMVLCVAQPGQLR